MNILQEICNDKRKVVKANKLKTPLAKLEQMAIAMGKTRGFAKALQDKAALGKTALIAEIKKASPSKGLIRADFNPTEIAKSYEAGGAACISVLTDEKYFMGSDDYLTTAKNATKLPVLRKDFMVDAYQIVESRSLGADCILLIMAALSDAQAKELYDLATDYNMDVLVEIHDEAELARAIDTLNPVLLGINNRNLKTMEISLNNTEKLVKLLPSNHKHHIICESGIFTNGDILRMNKSQVNSFLVGESLMRHENITAATKQLLGESGE